MCCTWVFRSSADGFCGDRIEKWHNPCEAVKAGQKCQRKSKRVIFKECCCSAKCCMKMRESTRIERHDVDTAFRKLKGELLGQVGLYELNEAGGFTFPDGILPTPEQHAELESLGSLYDHLNDLIDEHAKCETKRKALQPDEFQDSETLSDAADSLDPDLGEEES